MFLQKDKKEKKKKRGNETPSLLLDGEELENGVTEDVDAMQIDDDDKVKYENNMRKTVTI